MKKINIKQLLPLFFIATVFFISRSFNMVHIPGGISTEELKILSFLNIHEIVYAYYARLIPAFVFLLTSYILYFGFLTKTNNRLLSICIALVFILSPWSFAMSHILTLQIFIIFLASLYFLLPRSISYWYLAIYSIAFAAYYRIFAYSDFTSNIIALVDLKNLFFTGDYASFYLKIPFVGFFSFVDLLVFIIGLYALFTGNKMKKLQEIIIPFFCMGTILVFFNNLPNATYKTQFFLLSIGVVIGMGYYVLFSSYLINKYIRTIILILIACNLFYNLELYYHHFDYKNSTEWGYSKIQFIHYAKKQEINTFYITQDSADLLQYTDLFLVPKLKFIIISKDKIPTLCKNKYNRCILKEHELGLVGKSKDDIQTVFYHANGLPDYFLL